jgi:glycosyltransferase involved in cell wall biosynthesis
MTTSNLVAAILKPLHPQRVVWGLRASDLDLSQYDWLAQASSWLEARLSKTVDLIITNSTAGRRHAVSIGFPPGAIHVINNGFDIERWQRDPDAGARFRTIHELPANAPLVGLVARLDPLKGHRLFLEAAARLSDSQPGTHFVLVGAGPAALKAELQAFAHRLCPQLPVHWIGGQADMVPVYSALDCLVSASSSEGFPNVIAEAMACGLRPVVTDVGDSRDIVGSCGWVVPPGNAARMAGAIAEALSANRSSRPDPVVHIRTMYGLERLIDRSEALLGPELQ